jgi:hypothetical protein
MWTVVGGLLLAFGTRWTLAGRLPRPYLCLAGAAVAGLLKARFVLRITAMQAVERIRQRGDGRCIGGFLSWRSWAFVVGMVLLGRLLRAGLLPAPAVGLIYVAVGMALLAASAGLWLAWSAHGRAT